MYHLDDYFQILFFIAEVPGNYPNSNLKHGHFIDEYLIQ